MNKSHVGRVRQLYKTILRLHRVLPDDLKILGDNYAKEEFKRHKNCKPQEAQMFLNEWRKYVVSMLHQAAPARAQRPPADDQQAGTSREVGAKPVEAAPGYEAVSTSDHTLDEGGPARAVIQQSLGESQSSRSKSCKQFVKKRTAGAVVDGVIMKTSGRYQRRFGKNIDRDHLNKFNADQLLSLYELLMTAQGKKPLVEQGYEPIDTVNKNTTEVVKKEILKMDDETFKSIIGKIPDFNTNIKKMELIKLCDQIKMKQNNEHDDAINRMMVAHSELKKALNDLSSAQKELEIARKFADDAKIQLMYTGLYLDYVLMSYKINTAESLNEKVMKLSMIVKIKTEEDEAASQLVFEMLNNRRKDVE